MSLWKELYDIIDKERGRWLQTSAEKNALYFEIKANLAFMMDALETGLDEQMIVAGFETKAFEKALVTGIELPAKTGKTVPNSFIGKYKEFKPYIGQDSRFLIERLYLKISALQRVVRSSQAAQTTRRAKNALPVSTLKLKSLFRFLVFVVAFLDNKPLAQL